MNAKKYLNAFSVFLQQNVYGSNYCQYDCKSRNQWAEDMGNMVYVTKSRILSKGASAMPACCQVFS